MEEDALLLVLARNAFYRRLHYLALAAFALTIIVIGVLIGVLIFLIKHPTKPIYFATDEVGRLLQIVPVNQPNMSLEEVTTWVIEAVSSAYSYDYVNYRMQLQSAQKYFTSYGWSTYMKALSASNNILALQQRKMIVDAKVVEQPKLLVQGVLSGAYAWKFQMPVLLTYWIPPYDEKSRFANALQVTVIVQRQPILQAYKGLGIVQMIGTFVTTAEQPQEISATPSQS